MPVSQVSLGGPVSEGQTAIFQAEYRNEPITCYDCLIFSGKVIFFPITLLHYLIQTLCSKIAYHHGIGANRDIDQTKVDQLKDLGGERLRFRAADGVELDGMYFSNPNSVENAKTILICSGSHRSYEHFAPEMVDAYLKMGHHVMFFNYRGFGQSEGTPSQKGFYLDAEAAYQFLREIKSLREDQIVVQGYSMGSAPAVDLASHHKVKLVMDRYFSSMGDAAYDRGGLLAKVIFYLGDAEFDVKKKIKAVEENIFLARASGDGFSDSHTESLSALFSQEDKNRRVSFINVNGPHVHYSTDTLWFHPENNSNIEQRERFQNFLIS